MHFAILLRSDFSMFKKLITPIFIAIVLFALLVPTSFGEDYASAVITGSGSSLVAPITTPEAADALEARVKKEQEATLRANEAQAKLTEKLIREQQNQLTEKAGDIARIEQQIGDFSKHLEDLRSQIISLDNEKQVLEQSSAITSLKIQNVELQIEEKKQQIKETYAKIDFAEAAEKTQEKIVARFISLLYKQNKLYFQNNDSLALDPGYFLSNNDISSFILQKRYMERLREIGSDVIVDLKQVQSLLDFRKKQLAMDQQQLDEMDKRLQQEKIALEQQKESKQVLLASTKGEEALFQKLIQQAVEDEKRLENEIEGMQSSSGDIEAKIRLFSVKARNGQLSDDEIKDRVKTLMELGGDGKIGLDWPVEPLRGLAATFHDSSYIKRFGVPHNAIDIPTPQGTSIHSPADGYVTKVRDNGYGYSYIVVAHNGGIMTLYGHVTKILVNVGDFVKRGDIIGLSGAMPGTLGAGWMTTGPHLHFEVFLHGKHVDPLLYLDTSKLQK